MSKDVVVYSFGQFDAEALQDFLDEKLCEILSETIVGSVSVCWLMWILKLRWLPRLERNQEHNLKK